MMKEWHFNVLFFVGVLGAVAMLFGPEIGLDLGKNPTAVTGVSAILAYVLTKKEVIVKHPSDVKEKEISEKEGETDGP